MRRPKPRSRVSPNRRLIKTPDPDRIGELRENIRFVGSPKHKRNPKPFGLGPFNGKRGDETLCDRDAEFSIEDYRNISGMIDRGLRAGQFSENERLIWTVADNGWIFEGRVTNPQQFEYHGYPLLTKEPIVKLVYNRFREWARDSDDKAATGAAGACKRRYRFKK